MKKTKVAPKKFYVTKTRYVESYGCDKKLWLEKNKPLLAKEPSLSDKLNMKDGTKVGVMATELFSGTLVSEINGVAAAKHTFDLLMQGEKYIFEATFIFEGVFQVKVDILEKNEDGSYNIIEVKSANSVKKNYLIDVAFQKWVLEKCGLLVKDCYLKHLNRDYVRGEKLDKSELFTKENVTDDISLHYAQVEERVAKKNEALKSKSEPKMELGSHCKNPHKCPFYDHCHKNVNKDSVQKLSRLSAKKRAGLSAINTKYIKDIPKTFELTFRQGIQRIAATNENKIIINAEQIKTFLSGLVYPLIHLDFEAMVKAVPEYEGMKPNQFMVYQFAVDREQKNGKVKHFNYLHLSKADPRKVMAKKLLAACGVEGSIIVWNQSFEATRIKELANNLPEYREALLALIPRMVDIAVIFMKTWLYHHDMQGSASIKYVLPYLCPDLDYSSLAIGNGADSQAMYKKLMDGDFGPMKSEKAQAVIKNLIEYNDLDTWAMIRVLRRVQELVTETLNSTEPEVA